MTEFAARRSVMDMLSAIERLTWWPLCRAYARTRDDRPADRVLEHLCAVDFRSFQGFWPDFDNPTRLSEKLWCRMLRSRDPLLTNLSDKLLAREYVAERIGHEALVPLLWAGERPEDIPFDRLPKRFVIKTNHGAGYNVLVRDKRSLDVREVQNRLRRWLRENFCNDRYLGISWAYRNIARRVLVEQFLGDGEQPPVDYKFYCFGGRVEYALLHFDRYLDHRVLAVNRHFEPYPLRHNVTMVDGSAGDKPEGFDALVAMAERLAAGLSMIRVDLYETCGSHYFGEFTVYPGGTRLKFLPPEMDIRLGALWTGSVRSMRAE